MSRTITARSAWLRYPATIALRRIVGGTIVNVLCYHDVQPTAAPGAVSLSAFCWQLDFLQSHYRVVDVFETLHLVARGNGGPANLALITFDDGLAGTVKYAIPELERRKLPYVLFLISNAARGLMGPEYAHIDAILDQKSRLGTIGAHSMSHCRPLTAMTEVEVSYEVDASLEFVTRFNTNGVKLFCYPWAAYNDSIARKCRDVGFSAAFAGQWLRHHSPDRLYKLGRVTVDHDDDEWSFGKKLEGARDAQALWLELRRRRAESTIA